MKYYLFLDESGDQNLANFDEGFPIFTLCGIIISEEKYKLLENEVALMKQKFWNEKDVILHSRDIRKCQKGFENLFDLGVKQALNIAGLQIADLAAYPIANYVLAPEMVNFAYDVIKSKIYVQSGKMHGLKIHP
jgi:hypothetical protein